MSSAPAVNWADPENFEATYFFDRVHFPEPLSPLFQTTLGPAFSSGFEEGWRLLSLPRERLEVRFRHNYLYMRMVPVVPQTAEEANALARRAEDSSLAALPGLRQRWQDEALPLALEMQQRFRDIASMTPAEAATAANAQTIKNSLAALWGQHFRTVFPAFVALQLFDELAGDLFDAAFDSHALLAGLDSEVIAGGQAIGDLARLARELGLANHFASTEPDALEQSLAATPEGRQFLEQLDAVMAVFGLRQNGFDFLVPTWQEHRAVPLAQVRQYLASGRDTRTEGERLRAAAAEATAAARASLASYPEPVRIHFEEFLGYALDGAFLHAEHNVYIDQQAMALARYAWLRFGEGLVTRGVIDQPEDVFFLTFDDVVAAARGDAGDYRATVADARADFERSRTLQAPPFIGPPPSAPDSDSPQIDLTVDRAVSRFIGMPQAPSDDPDVLSGYAGSPGQITGIAFVARTLEEASSIPPGHILVTVATLPAWTPLFGYAGGVVTETGGPLSHTAIVAREYGIPAVVGAAGALQHITTGQEITIDGAGGVVRLR